MRVELRVWEKSGVEMGEGVGDEESGDGEENRKCSGSGSEVKKLKHNIHPGVKKKRNWQNPDSR
jgi:hypothetical protein